MAPKTSWHRYGTDLLHRQPMFINSLAREWLLAQSVASCNVANNSWLVNIEERTSIKQPLAVYLNVCQVYFANSEFWCVKYCHYTVHKYICLFSYSFFVWFIIHISLVRLSARCWLIKKIINSNKYFTLINQTTKNTLIIASVEQGSHRPQTPPPVLPHGKLL